MNSSSSSSSPERHGRTCAESTSTPCLDPRLAELVSASPRVTDRRRSHREPVATTGTIKCAERGDTSPARQVLVTDVSLHGVGIRSSTQMTMGATYYIEIGVGPLYLSSQVRIVRSQQRSDGTYDIGGEFCSV